MTNEREEALRLDEQLSLLDQAGFGICGVPLKSASHIDPRLFTLIRLARQSAPQGEPVLSTILKSVSTVGTGSRWRPGSCARSAAVSI